MKKAIRVILPILFIVIILICAVAAVVNFLYYGGEVKDVQPAESFFQYGECKGFFVRTGGDKPDFPSAPGLGSKELKAELDAILDFAVDSGFKTVFFEARPDSAALYHSDYFPTSAAIVAQEGGFTLFDPLSYLCKQASERNLELFAVVSAYEIGPTGREYSSKNPLNNSQYPHLTQDGVYYLDPTSSQVGQLLAESCRELAQNYPLSGVVVNGADAPALRSVNNLPALVWDMLTAARQAMDTVSPQKRLGLILDGVPGSGGFGISPDTAAGMVKSGAVDLLLPKLYTSVGEEQNSYGELSAQWSAAVEGSEARMVAVLPVYKFYGGENSYDNPDEIGYQLFLNTLDSNISGTAFSAYGDLVSHPGDTEHLMSFMWESTNPPSFELAISQELAVGNPSQNVTLDNSYTKYFITGTSDPSRPLTMDGQELTRTTTGGGWGVMVPLSVGANTFTFTQGDKSVPVTLTRLPPATPTPISGILKSSLFPTATRGYHAGDSVELSCTAPSGGSVTAQIGDETLTLTQTGPASPGLPAVFTGSYRIPADLPAGETVSLGSVTYTLRYGGTNTTYRSVGELVAAGSGARLSAEVSALMAGVYTSSGTVDGFVTSLAQGSRLYLTGRYEGSRAIVDMNGLEGYIDLSSITFLTGRNTLENSIFDIFYEQDGKGESFSLRGSSPSPYSVEVTETSLAVTLYGASFEHNDFSALELDLFESLTVENRDGNALVTLALKPGRALWGWDITYDEGGILLYCKKPPQLSGAYSRPLEGVTVMVDAGHGGDDPGAMGSAGAGGPNEAVMNLALASTLRYRLEQLGATVSMTRPDNDTTLELQDRVALASYQRPDFFIAVHHNSTALTVDASNISAAYVYYCFENAKSFSEKILEQFALKVGRDVEPAEYGAYYVTRISYSPAVLVETGFISNPKEQEDCIDSINIYKEACAIAQAVVETLK